MPLSLGDFAPHEGLRTFDFDQFLGLDIPKRELLLSPWLPAKGLALVYAQRGVGKTHLCLSIAYAVATGGQLMGWDAPRPQKVLWVDGEMPARALQERVAMLSEASASRPLPNAFRLMPYDLSELGGPDLSTIEGQEDLEPHIGDAALIVIDNISTICRAGKENEAESWTIMQQWALDQRRKGRAVLFVHHAGKGGDQRGTSKREDVMDTVIKLSRPSDYRASEGARFVVEYTKARGFSGPDADPFEATFREGQWSAAPVQNYRDAEIIDLARQGVTQRSIAERVGCGVATVNRVVRGSRP